jgi:lysophospholipase L1-like esterase
MSRRRSIRLRAIVAAATAALFGALAVTATTGATALGAAPPVPVPPTTAPPSSGQGVVETTIPTIGPYGGIALVGDSLLVGSSLETNDWGPSVARLLVDRGWGPVRTRAGVGFQTGRTLPSTSTANLGTWLYQQRLDGFDPAVVLVNLGTNDINSCRGSSACAFANIRHLMDIIGPDRQVWWSMISVPDPDREKTWNDALRAVATQRSNLVLWDWPEVQASQQVTMAPDGIHLQGASAYRQRSVLIAEDVTARLGTTRSDSVPMPTPTVTAPTTSEPATTSTTSTTTTTTTVAPAATTTTTTVPASTTTTSTTTTTTLPEPFTPDLPEASEPLFYRAIEPRRLVDTRVDSARLGSGITLVVDLDRVAPDLDGLDAVDAVAVNVTSVDARGSGHLTVWPCGTDRPATSTLNIDADSVRSAQTIAALGRDDELCVFASVATDVLVDLQGVFSEGSGDRFDPLLPARVLDTRQTGRKRLLTLAAPEGVSAVAMTITVTGGARPGFLTAYGCTDAPPLASTVNWEAFETVAGAAFAPVGQSGLVCLATSSDVDVVVDVTGTFSPGGRLRFRPVTPARMIDTRDGAGGRVEPLEADRSMSAVAAPSDASAVSGTLTLVAPARDGYLTATVCGSPPGKTSSVNAERGGVMASGVTVALSAGGELCIHAHASSDVLFDVTGWWSE